MTQQMTAMEKRNSQQVTRFNSVRRLLESEGVRNQVALALPKHMTPERMLRIGVTALQNNPRLLDCSEGSLVKAITEAAELGLEVNTPLGFAYLVPYKDQVTLQVGYRGFIALAHRSGRISSLAAEVVYENDRFAVELGTNRQLVHTPFLTGEPGKKIGVYATVRFKDGTTDFEYMSAEEVGGIRSRSKSKDSGPWVTDEAEMWRKTPIRRLAKRLPVTADDQSLLRAAIIDEYNDAGVDVPSSLPPAPPKAAVISEDQRAEIVKAAKKSGADLNTVLANAGFELLAEITVDAFADVLAAAAIKPEPEAKKSEPIQGERVDPDESIRMDLIIAVNEAIAEKIGGMPSDRKTFLKDKVVENMTAEELSELLHELQGAKQ